VYLFIYTRRLSNSVVVAELLMVTWQRHDSSLMTLMWLCLVRRAFPGGVCRTDRNRQVWRVWPSTQLQTRRSGSQSQPRNGSGSSPPHLLMHIHASPNPPNMFPREIFSLQWFSGSTLACGVRSPSI